MQGVDYLVRQATAAWKTDGQLISALEIIMAHIEGDSLVETYLDSVSSYGQKRDLVREWGIMEMMPCIMEESWKTGRSRRSNWELALMSLH